MEKKYTKATIEKASGDADFIAVASTASEDRHGEIVSVEGWDLKAFKANPVLLWSHDHSVPALGIAVKTWIDKTGKGALMIKGKFHEHTEESRAMKLMVAEGIIKTMSVGFLPSERDGNTYTKQELLEVSFVNVPANSQAMITAYKSLKDAGFKNKTITGLGIPTAILDRLEKQQIEIDAVKEQLQTVVKAQDPVNPQVRSKVLRQRQAMYKVIARTADKLLEGEKRKNLKKEDRTKFLKVIKTANEHLLIAQKDLIKHGENSRTIREKG